MTTIEIALAAVVITQNVVLTVSGAVAYSRKRSITTE